MSSSPRTLDGGSTLASSQNLTDTELRAQSQIPPSDLTHAPYRQDSLMLPPNHLIHTLPGIVCLRQNDASASVSFLSEGCLAITGFGASELLGSAQTYNGLIRPEDRVQLLEALAIAHQHHQPYQVEYRIVCKTGEEKWLSERGQLAIDPTYPNHWVCMITDVTATRQVEEQLRLDVFLDQLTQLPNRGLFMDRLAQAVRRHQRYPGNQFAVLFLDLDRFKIINDSLGHLVGDRLLQNVAQRLQGCLRPTDTIARLGGDEFTILVEDAKNSADVFLVADRILQALSQPFLLDGHEAYSSASIGIAFSRSDYQGPEELIRDADIAMYRAKAAGKARYVVFDPQMRSPALNLLRMETDLRRALERNELELYYQPIVCLEDNQIVGFEALLRWIHPEHGLLLPQSFIPIAEEAGMLLALDEWVLNEACQQLQQWSLAFPDYPALTVSVNLSNRQFAQPNAAERVRVALEQTGLPGNRLQIEINEGVIIQNRESVALKLRSLQEMGVQISLDDFGTGYSSLSYLHQFPVNRLKVDRAFIKSVHTQKNLAIVHTIIDLAHNLGIDVVAEGVETGAQLAQIKVFDCEYGQGYWFAKPLTAQAAEALLIQGSPHMEPNRDYPIPQLKISTPGGYSYFPLTGKTAWKIGRSKDSSIFLADRWVSQEHAILQLIGMDDIYWVDLSSRNGSYINGQRIQSPVLLQPGDRLRIGQTSIEFQYVQQGLPLESAMPSSIDVTDDLLLSNLRLKTVLMIQPSKIQGEIWREALTSQGIYVIWPDELNHPIVQDSSWLMAHQSQPDLLLVDLQISGVDPYTLIRNYLQQYPKLQVVVTDSLRSQIDPLNRAWILRQGIADLLPRFQEDVDSPFRLPDVAERVSLLLSYLQAMPLKREALSTALLTLQQVFRQETLS
jgi:diguanylate cyclase (GGDEF)-like protein/PAS domain S-box-containing protein